VHSEKIGRVRTCRLEPDAMHSVEHWLADHRMAWERRFDRLSQVLDETFPDHEGDRNR
jgi:hypothetical protein